MTADALLVEANAVAQAAAHAAYMRHSRVMGSKLRNLKYWERQVYVQPGARAEQKLAAATAAWEAGRVESAALGDLWARTAPAVD